MNRIEELKKTLDLAWANYENAMKNGEHVELSDSFFEAEVELCYYGIHVNRCLLSYGFGNHEDSKWFWDRDEAVKIADLIYHFGGWANILCDIYEYTPQTGWENMCY